MRNTITFETYPPMFVDYNTYEENTDYDYTMRVFTVPYDWYIRWLKARTFIHGYPDDETFQNEYTWDDTLNMYDHAVYEDMIIEEHIEGR